jgi:GT2 family glycosyltransferase
MIDNKLIGVGIITYQRFDRFKECYINLIANAEKVDKIVIVEDCSNKDKDKYDLFFEQLMNDKVIVIRNKFNQGVGFSKNCVLKHLYDSGCEYIFTLEDDINVVNKDVFEKYIMASKITGLQHFNFAHHGPANVNRQVNLVTLNGFIVECYPEIVGAFTLYTRKLIDTIGYFDLNYHNAWEHVDYTYRASKAELTTQFWEFADIPNSKMLLQEQDDAITDSSIRPRSDWQDNIKKGLIYWNKKYSIELVHIPGRR